MVVVRFFKTKARRGRSASGMPLGCTLTEKQHRYWKTWPDFLNTRVAHFLRFKEKPSHQFNCENGIFLALLSLRKGWLLASIFGTLPAVRVFLLFLTALLGACTSVPKAPKLSSEIGYLSQKNTRKLVEHWAGSGYPATVKGRPIHFANRNQELDHITGVTPADDFSRDDKDPSHLGTLVMAHSNFDRELKEITPRAWQVTDQPTTIVARSEQDGSIQLTSLDFREQHSLNGRPLASDFRLPFDYVEKNEGKPIARILTLLDPSGWADRRGFYLATEYDPEKIPLIFIHGLLSTPVDFARLASSISSQQDLWDRYQFWFYFYPTGDPWVLTAANFREDFPHPRRHP